MILALVFSAVISCSLNTQPTELYSNNYFDLLPGEKAIINLKTSISEDKLKDVLTIRTLDDAF